MSWFQGNGVPVNWEAVDGTLICWLAKPAPFEDPSGLGRDLLILLNPTPESRLFQLPEQARGLRWRLFLDTSKDSPADIYPDLDGPEPPANRQIELIYRSMMAFVGDES